MKTFVIAAAIAGLAVGTAYAQPGPPPSGPMCLWSHDVDHSHVSEDTKSITFYMVSGPNYRTELPHACPGLKFHGFAAIEPQGQFCAGQGIHVLVTGQTCSLGDFVPVADAPHAMR